MCAVAIYALTDTGAKLGELLARRLDGELFVSRRLEKYPQSTVFDSLVPFFRSQYQAYSSHIFIAAAGIAVRCVAPLLEGKDKDPAIVAVDQRGHFVISLLSGHLGGANRLARQVATITKGQAVITTATDTEKLPALDTLAQECGLALADTKAIKTVNAALLAGQPVQVLDPDNWLGLVPPQGQPAPWPDYFRVLATDSEWTAGAPGVWVSYKKNIADKTALLLHPPCLALGIGCRRGASAQEIQTLLKKTFDSHNLAPQAIAGLASITAKQDEPGLLETAAKLGAPLTFFTPEVLEKISVPHPSERVIHYMGVPSVCEAAAMKLATTSTLLIPKTKSKRVTLAVAV